MHDFWRGLKLIVSSVGLFSPDHIHVPTPLPISSSSDLTSDPSHLATGSKNVLQEVQAVTLTPGKRKHHAEIAPSPRQTTSHHSILSCVHPYTLSPTPSYTPTLHTSPSTVSPSFPPPHSTHHHQPSSSAICETSQPSLNS